MTANVAIVRYNKQLAETDEKLREMMERWQNINLVDSEAYSNQTVMFTKQLKT